MDTDDTGGVQMGTAAAVIDRAPLLALDTNSYLHQTIRPWFFSTYKRRNVVGEYRSEPPNVYWQTGKKHQH